MIVSTNQDGQMRFDAEIQLPSSYRLKLSLSVPLGMTKAQSDEYNKRVVDLLVALSEFDAATGGVGLQILECSSQEPA